MRKLKQRLLVMGYGLWIMSSCALTSMLCSSCGDGYDLADDDPAWLGSSIYEYLESNGNYQNTVKLIDDLGYREVLRKTGSKTLFVADDDAFSRFYQQNDWGVKNYEGLTTAQKKLLLYGSMINNACQVAYLSSSEGPKEGDCMRRVTATSVQDSVPVMATSDMPESPYWQFYKESQKPIVCYQDMTSRPMIHFIQAFLENKLITNDDMKFLQNGEVRTDGDANVNGVIMTEQNIKCSNGFIHKMADVITPLPNMAQMINQKPEMSQFASLMERFCAPYPLSNSDLLEYKRLHGEDITVEGQTYAVDTVFQKRYFSERSHGGQTLELTPDEGPVNGTLKFDPGWSQFYSETSVTDENMALMENMAVMLVPSNAAMDLYWNGAEGTEEKNVLKERYGTWENVPDKVVSKLINVNMLNSFTNSVPSKFATVLDDANDKFGLEEKDVDHVYMTCNGAIYLTNRVMQPVAYKSVHFPALVNDNMSIFYWAIEQCGFDVYLNSQNSYYSLFIPTNDAMLCYVDPCSFGKVNTQVFKFYYKPTAQTETQKVWASIWNADIDSQGVMTITDSIGEATYSQITDRLKDILDYHIIVDDVQSGNTYYKTKGGGTIMVDKASLRDHGMTVSGSWQEANNQPVEVNTVYDQDNKGGNGKTYILEGAPLQTTRKTVSDILKEHEEFNAFYDLVEACGLFETKHVIGTDEHACGGENISLFNTFNYTVYVPSKEGIEALQAAGEIPTLDMLDDTDTYTDEERDSLRDVLTLFVKYHIQDNSLYIGGGSSDAKYETFAYRVEDDNLLYYKVQAKASNDDITIIDDNGTEHHVVQTPGLYNQMAREYQYNSSTAASATSLYTSSYAVVHLIDSPLTFKKGGQE